MANPYDFTSGYFQSRSLAEQRQQAIERKQIAEDANKLQRDEFEARKPYFGALTDQLKASGLKIGAETEGIGLANDLTRTYIPRIQQLLSKNSPKLGAKGGSTFDPKKFSSPDFGFKADYNLVDPSDPEDFDRYVDGGAVKSFANGTPGGLKVPKRTEAISTSAEVPQPDAMAPERISPLQVLSDNDPQKATTLTQNIFGATPKEFQEMLGAFSMIDFARGKATSKDLLNQVDNIRKMQAEGVGVAIQRGLAGDFKGAQQAFDESGDQRFGDNIQSMKKIKIENVVPGAALKTKDFYEGLELTLKDGSKMTLDPRRLLAETVSLKEVVDNDYRFGNSIRQNDASVFSTQSANARTALDRQVRNDQLDERLEQKDRSMYQQGLKGMIDRDYNAWLSSQDANLTISPELKQKRYNDIEASYANNQYLGNLNINAGNRQVDPFTVKKYSPYLDASTPGASDFWSNNSNFRTDANGNRLEKQTNAGVLVMTKDGVMLPLPVKPPSAPKPVDAQPKPTQQQILENSYRRNQSPGYQNQK